ncbi:uncharacterized protein MYCGRDRAFT_97402 [Zymoseptoria tritici IPO323]|uniref:Uncharacterized protein n=1 Tax=Zymoseptoria tritici (strain CBS 115943 / IPO323) TaxID=336722 RepID=F9XQ39_ZYMTI|nr:uncharacterized protein MYCGRDRAFT_97402 [Zymoseptoria tritici IPO323]EGP82722.1 hypothetical protein MYCGRDRAFT_97402 [Zymoseptoria tritici IPO323]
MELADNFPRLYPAPPILAHSHRTRPSVAGDRGLTQGSINEQRMCDQQYLHSLASKVENIDLLILHHAAQHQHVEKEEVRQHMILDPKKDAEQIRDYIAENPQFALCDALLSLQQLLPELRRALTNRTLFRDLQARLEFFQRIKLAVLSSKQLIEHDLETRQLFEDLSRRLQQDTTSHPVHADGERTPPWLSWSRPGPLRKEAPFLTVCPGLRMFCAQIIAPNGVAIIEHWRGKLEVVVGTLLVTAGMQPHLTRQMPPDMHSVISMTKIRPDGKRAVVAVPSIAPGIERCRNVYAFGKQEQVAEMGRFMAALTDDVVYLRARWMSIVSNCARVEDIIEDVEYDARLLNDAEAFSF